MNSSVQHHHRCADESFVGTLSIAGYGCATVRHELQILSPYVATKSSSRRYLLSSGIIVKLRLRLRGSVTICRSVAINYASARRNLSYKVWNKSPSLLEFVLIKHLLKYNSNKSKCYLDRVLTQVCAELLEYVTRDQSSSMTPSIPLLMPMPYRKKSLIPRIN